MKIADLCVNLHHWTVSSAGLERCLDRAEVTGSNPVRFTCFLYAKWPTFCRPFPLFPGCPPPLPINSLTTWYDWSVATCISVPRKQCLSPGRREPSRTFHETDPDHYIHLPAELSPCCLSPSQTKVDKPVETEHSFPSWSPHSCLELSPPYWAGIRKRNYSIDCIKS